MNAYVCRWVWCACVFACLGVCVCVGVCLIGRVFVRALALSDVFDLCYLYGCMCWLCRCSCVWELVCLLGARLVGWLYEWVCLSVCLSV